MIAKKKMLIPLGKAGSIWPQRRADKTRSFIFHSIVFVLKLFFGWIGWIFDRLAYRRFSNEIRNHLGFLFTEHGAHILPKKHSKSATVVSVICGSTCFEFGRFESEFHVSVASEFAPEHKEPFGLITEGQTQWGDAHREAYELETFAPILRRHLPLLEEAFQR